jgi:hypothetical protein
MTAFSPTSIGGATGDPSFGFEGTFVTVGQASGADDEQGDIVDRDQQYRSELFDIYSKRDQSVLSTKTGLTEKEHPMFYEENELSRVLYGGRPGLHSPDFEGMTFVPERRLNWPMIGRAFRSVVRKIR